jgi:hypothetical protein
MSLATLDQKPYFTKSIKMKSKSQVLAGNSDEDQPKPISPRGLSIWICNCAGHIITYVCRVFRNLKLLQLSDSNPKATTDETELPHSVDEHADGIPQDVDGSPKAFASDFDLEEFHRIDAINHPIDYLNEGPATDDLGCQDFTACDHECGYCGYCDY